MRGFPSLLVGATQVQPPPRERRLGVAMTPLYT